MISTNINLEITVVPLTELIGRNSHIGLFIFKLNLRVANVLDQILVDVRPLLTNDQFCQRQVGKNDSFKRAEKRSKNIAKDISQSEH